MQDLQTVPGATISPPSALLCGGPVVTIPPAIFCSVVALWPPSPPEYELLYPAVNPACPLYYSLGGDHKDWEPEVSLEQDLRD